MGFIDTMRAEGHAVESICRVLREQGCQVAARTYRSWKRTGRVVAARTVADAHVVDAVRDIAWTAKVDGDGVLVRKLAPEGLYGRRKMTAHLRRTVVPEASFGSVDRAMRTLGLSGVRRDKGIRTTIPAKDGIRAGDLLDRDFTAAAPPLQDHRRRRIRHRRLGRLVQQPTPALDAGKRPARRVRASPLRCSQPRAAPRIGTAENPGRFTEPQDHLALLEIK